MKLGLLSDIHGNRVALAAVIADGRARGVDQWWVLGDLVAVGADPNGTLEVLGNLANVTVTRGNTERYVLTADRPGPHTPTTCAGESGAARPVRRRRRIICLDARCPHRGRGARVARRAPISKFESTSTTGPVLGVHASPGCDDGAGITPHRAADELRAAVADAGADVVCAGSYAPANRSPYRRGARINLGSVSNPITDDLHASYVVIESDRHGHDLAHHRVAYDRDAFIRSVERSGHPEAAYILSFHAASSSVIPAATGRPRPR